MRVLVTGGTSLLGSVTAAQLIAQGHEVTLFQRHASGSGLPEVLGDVSDGAKVRQAVAGHDAVLHLAAKVGVAGRADEFDRINIDGTRNVITAMRAHDVPRLVFVSSPSVAHTGKALVGADAGPADPENVRGDYSRTKAVAEQLVLNSALPEVVAIRPHLVWGPGDEQLIGRIVHRAKVGRLAVIGTGAALIDTTYIDNAASALVAAVERTPAVHGRALVVSNGEPRTVLELFERIVQAANVRTSIRHVSPGIGKPAAAGIAGATRVFAPEVEPLLTPFLVQQLSTAHWFDQRETQSLLQWQPKVTLAQGFERLSSWFAHQ